ncbi:hypothetical protein HanRHA438_Chr09g0382051 [Helianthus annuus]|nr:hypothetical protein HanRHA438_Chr09g0382051 [Helianthus annuus]
MTSSHFLGNPSLPEMVMIISLSLTARMKWFRAIWSATSPISRHSLLYRMTNASSDSSSLRQMFMTSNESRSWRRCWLKWARNLVRKSSNESSDPTGKESNHALARPVRVWGEKITPSGFIPLAVDARAHEDVHVVVRVGRTTVFPNVEWELCRGDMGVGNPRAELGIFGRCLWPVWLVRRALCRPKVCVAGVTGRNIVASSRSAAGVMRITAVAMVVRVGMTVPFGVWLRAQSALNAWAASGG